MTRNQTSQYKNQVAELAAETPVPIEALEAMGEIIAFLSGVAGVAETAAQELEKKEQSPHGQS